MANLFGRLGLLLGIGFGALWASWATSLLTLGIAGGLVVAAASAALAIAALLRPLRALPPARASGRRSAIWYGVIVLGEIVALNLLFILIETHGWQAYRLPAIGLIIGLHFFPLGRAMRFPPFHLLGAMMAAAALCTIAAIAAGFAPHLASGLDALVNAMLLWGSVALSLLPARPHLAARPRVL